MQFYRTRAIRYSVLTFLLLLPANRSAAFLDQSQANVQTQGEAAKIIEQSVENLKKDWAAEPRFDCSERDKDKSGDKTYQDIMLYGSPYRKLIAVNNQPLNAREQAEQEKKLQAAESRRRAESDSQRRARIAKYEAERKHATELIVEISKAFTFTTAGQEKLGSHDVYVLNAEPRKGYRPPNRETRALTGMHGKLWIERTSLQWVKVEVEVFRPVTISTFIARVEPGTHFVLEQQPVSQEMWLPSHFAVHSQAKVMMLFSHQTSEDETYVDYHPAKNVQSRSGGSH